MSTRLKEWTVLSMLEWGTEYFKKKDIPDPRHSIEWLLAETLQVKRLDLYLKFDRPLSQTELDTIRPLVKKRAQHEPLQYIIGYTEFMNAHITVSPDVLIPRIETEQLVEIILDNHPPDNSLSVLDIGTGSGCIPIALKMERPGWNVEALDISADALGIARQNAEANKTEINFWEGDILQWNQLSFNHSFNLMVSNPPYVLPAEKKLLEKQVVNHEPSLALFCENPEEMYGSIIECAQSHLTSNGTLYLEIHEQYSKSVLHFFNTSLWETSLLKDYEKKPRFIIARLINQP